MPSSTPMLPPRLPLPDLGNGYASGFASSLTAGLNQTTQQIFQVLLQKQQQRAAIAQNMVSGLLQAGTPESKALGLTLLNDQKFLENPSKLNIDQYTSTPQYEQMLGLTQRLIDSSKAQGGAQITPELGGASQPASALAPSAPSTSAAMSANSPSQAGSSPLNLLMGAQAGPQTSQGPQAPPVPPTFGGPSSSTATQPLAPIASQAPMASPAPPTQPTPPNVNQLTPQEQRAPATTYSGAIKGLQDQLDDIDKQYKKYDRVAGKHVYTDDNQAEVAKGLSRAIASFKHSQSVGDDFDQAQENAGLAANSAIPGMIGATANKTLTTKAYQDIRDLGNKTDRTPEEDKRLEIAQQIIANASGGVTQRDMFKARTQKEIQELKNNFMHGENVFKASEAYKRAGMSRGRPFHLLTTDADGNPAVLIGDPNTGESKLVSTGGIKLTQTDRSSFQSLKDAQQHMGELIKMMEDAGVQNESGAVPWATAQINKVLYDNGISYSDWDEKKQQLLGKTRSDVLQAAKNARLKAALDELVTHFPRANQDPHAFYQSAINFSGLLDDNSANFWSSFGKSGPTGNLGGGGPPQVPGAPTGSGQVIRFDAQGNVIQ